MLWLERYDRRDAVIDPAVVDQRRVEGRGQRETAERALDEIVDRGLAARDVFPADHQHQHPVDPVPVHALRGRAAFLALARLDAKLVDFDMPRLGTQLCRRHPVEQGMARAQNRGERRVSRYGIGHRLEPALDAAVERVVIAALIMRLARLADDPAGAGAENAKPAAAVAPAISHIGVDAQIVPAGGKAFPVAQPGFVQYPLHLRSSDKGDAAISDRTRDRGQQLVHRPVLDLSPIPSGYAAPRSLIKPRSSSRRARARRCWSVALRGPWARDGLRHRFR